MAGGLAPTDPRAGAAALAPAASLPDHEHAGAKAATDPEHAGATAATDQRLAATAVIDPGPRAVPLAATEPDQCQGKSSSCSSTS